jgi:hypothetical protein
MMGFLFAAEKKQRRDLHQMFNIMLVGTRGDKNSVSKLNKVLED